MKFDQKTILITLAALVVAGGAYWYFFTGSGNDAPLTAITGSGVSQTRFQTLVSELQPITFDTSIFSDPRFLALVNISTDLTPESTGRLDPFAPVAGTAKK